MGMLHKTPGRWCKRRRTFYKQSHHQGNRKLTLNRTSSVHTNGGTITATAADFTLSQSGTTPSFTNTGTVTIGAGRIWTVNSGTFTQQAGATIAGGGALTFNSATATFATGFTLGSLTLISSVANLTANLSTGVLALTLNSSTINGPGQITNPSGQTLALYYSTIGATSALNNQGTLIANGSSAVNGPLTTAAGSIIRLQPDGTSGFSNLTVATGFTNNGGIELTSLISTYSANLIVTAGTLTNAAGGTISSLVGTGGTRTLTAELNNQGLVTNPRAATDDGH